MKIRVISVCGKIPNWVQMGVDEYVRRMPPDFSVEFVTIPLQKRGKEDSSRLIAEEGEKMLRAADPFQIALDQRGEMLTSEALALRLEKWQAQARSMSLLIGGPEGLAPACLKSAQGKWSLSPLTLPHPLVRVIVAEQLYRAVSILKNHPYHRG
jgi:23S rRNA (pseudouridine1915-N3)-methyltransferase